MYIESHDPIVEALKQRHDNDMPLLERRAIENPDGPAARFLKWLEQSPKKH